MDRETRITDTNPVHSTPRPPMNYLPIFSHTTGLALVYVTAKGWIICQPCANKQPEQPYPLSSKDLSSKRTTCNICNNHL